MGVKSIDQIERIAVVGAGTMGAGIAQLSAMAGFHTTLSDLSEVQLDKSEAGITKNLDKGIEKGKVTEEQKTTALKNLHFTTHKDLEADVIIEAIIEDLEVKTELFQYLAGENGENTILATNTSSIPITRLAAHIHKPERVVGMHFFNPAHIMKLVEVISGAATDPAVAKTVAQLAEKMGKTPVMAKDAPGFIVNRVARNFYVESLKLVEEQVADFETVDALVQSSGFKMGPFRLMDLIGVDSNYRVTTSMYESFHYDPKFRPSRVQQQKVDAGHHGRKTGRGFYSYEE